MSRRKVTMGVELFGPDIECPKCSGKTSGLGNKTMLITCSHCKHVINPFKPEPKSTQMNMAYALYLEYVKIHNVPDTHIMGEEEFMKTVYSQIPENILQDGDYCEDLTDAQVYELLKIEDVTGAVDASSLYGGVVVYEYGILCPPNGLDNRKTKLDFAQMRERCINTFRKTI